tara:strand:+ start:292 stop:630 length:339 start_codon:yes stop_codon:yes gene_type:complete
MRVARCLTLLLLVPPLHSLTTVAVVGAHTLTGRAACARVRFYGLEPFKVRIGDGSAFCKGSDEVGLRGIVVDAEAVSPYGIREVERAFPSTPLRSVRTAQDARAAVDEIMKR